jgi:hypothetical protein
VSDGQVCAHQDGARNECGCKIPRVISSAV